MSHRTLALVVAFAAVALLAVGLARAARRPAAGPWGDALRGLAASGITMLALLLVLEVGFEHLFVRSDGLGRTLAARQWFARHWGPTNAHGFRDDAIPRAGRRLFVVGDSFVAGHGVADRAARFADRLAPHLRPGWSVVNFARNGWSTRDQLEAIRGASPAPDALVWSWYVNDVEGAAERVGKGEPPPRHEPHALLRPLVERSYLADFVYWRLARLAGEQAAAAYWERRRAMVRDPAIWEAHRRELEAVVDYARDRDLPLVVVVFPHLVDPEGSRPATRRVARLFRARGVPVVDLTARVASRAPAAWVVNAMDAHPNARLHAEVAARLVPELASLGLVGDGARHAGLAPGAAGR